MVGISQGNKKGEGDLKGQNVLVKNPSPRGMLKKLEDVQCSWGVQDAGERAEAPGHGKGVGRCSHGNGKPPKGLSREMYAHICTHAFMSPYTSTLAKLINLPCHQQIPTGLPLPWMQERNKASTFLINIPQQPLSGVLHDFLLANLEKPQYCPLRVLNIGKW